ncbi:LuxR C-terminal-related transcriptional regulator [Sphingomonas beigongshangi]|uniref:LuxR C-terminal-related transcriptional regulator n=1 Tax=Sphingomonas beigongshangi TaxID=2782540 RepID=UPI001EEE49DD|nr:LuxR C-terminal-related transcriptional regulator [Sphingomonas beigongshangi]
MAAEGDRLATLTATEQDILRRLAAGHTAKSIAAETGLSVNAVNERLREARRKTGATSSRELARLFIAQENRDEQIGVAQPPDAGQVEPDPPHRATGLLRMGPLVMTILIGLVAAATLTGTLIQNDPVKENGGMPDQLLGSLAVDHPDQVSTLHGQVRRETRDSAWATEAEAALANRFGAIANVDSLRVLCAAKLCEVAGRLRPGSASGPALLAVQQLSLTGVRDLGFGDSVFSVGGKAMGKGDPFVVYLKRIPTTVPHMISTSPAQGATIPAGPYTLSVTFDRPMRARSYSFVTSNVGDYPDCDGKPQQSPDGRTFTMRCSAVAGRTYAIGFNSERFGNFASVDGVSATPSMLSFDTRR